VACFFYGLLSGQPLKDALLVAAKANIRLFRLRDWVHAAPRAELHAVMAETFVKIRRRLRHLLYRCLLSDGGIPGGYCSQRPK
jgi:hypothetical protein